MYNFELMTEWIQQPKTNKFYFSARTTIDTSNINSKQLQFLFWDVTLLGAKSLHNTLRAKELHSWYYELKGQISGKNVSQ